MSEDKKIERTIHFYGDVNPANIKTVFEAILKINDEDNKREEKEKDFVREPIKLYVNSYGGYCYDGLGLVSAILESKAPIHTYVHGYAMSMGFLIAAVGHKRFASKHATYMYHQVSSGAWGTLEWMKQEVAESQRLMDVYNDILLSVSNIRKDELQNVQERHKDWFMTSDEAKKLGIVDEVL
jgi:ATP-dependent Clp protease protease subunit